MAQRAMESTVDGLVATGKHRQAIELLNRANREHRDADVETRLVELRRDTPVPSAAKSGRAWPFKVRDQFRHVAGIPEITRDQLTPKLLRSGIQRHGCLLVRGLIGQPRVDQLVRDIDEAFAGYDAHVNGAPTAETSPWFAPFEPRDGESVPREWVRNGDGVLAVDSPRTLFDTIEAFDEAGVRDLVSAYLGGPPLLLANKWTLRKVEPRDVSLDWHQDGSFLGTEIKTVDVWVSLSHCGVDAPGLDVAGRRFDGIVGVGTDEASFDWTVPEQVVAQLAPGQVVRPVFAPGDALIFDHLLLHRTAYGPTMHRTRYAIEAWFAASSAYPPGALPIAY